MPTQDVESFDKIKVLVTASSGTTVIPTATTDCTIIPNTAQISPYTFEIANFTGSSYVASFTDEGGGNLSYTGNVSATGGWISDKEQFTTKAVYGTKEIDLKYTVVKSKDGATGGGFDGGSVDIIFQRYDISQSPSSPIAPSPSVGTPVGWFTNPPTGTDPLFASQGVKYAGSTNYTWGTPYRVEGSSVVEIAIYKKDDSNTPSGGSYDFTTNTLNTSGLTAGWSQTPPATLGNLESVYKSVGLFVGGPEETGATTSWSPTGVTAFRQDGSAGTDAKTVKLTPSSFVVKYNTAGVEIGSPNQISFTTDVQNISGSPNYRFLVDGVEKQNTTTDTFTLADADEPGIGEVVEVSVEVYDTAPSPDELLATDSISIYAVQDGSDAIIGLLTNSAHTVSAASDGTLASGALDDAGGTFKVFVGGTEVTTSCTFSVVGTPASTTTTINSSTGVYSITALSANQDNVTYQAVIPAATAGTSGDIILTAIYSISKSIDGNQGLRSTTGLIYYTVASATIPSTPTATNYVFSTISFSSLTANWSLERPTITASNANNFWESTFNATEDSAASDVSSSSTSPPNLTFSLPVRVQDGFGDSITENVIDINAAATKWVGVDVVSFTEDSANKPHPRSSTEYKYTYNNTAGNLEFAFGASNTDLSWTTTSHSLFAGDTEVARIKIRHIAEPFSSGNVQQTDKIKSIYYEFEVVGSPGTTYSTESNYEVTLSSSSSPSFTYTSSWVGSGSPATNGYDEIQNHDMTALSGYQVSLEHLPTKALKTIYISYTGVADSLIEIDGSTGGK